MRELAVHFSLAMHGVGVVWLATVVSVDVPVPGMHLMSEWTEEVSLTSAPVFAPIQDVERSQPKAGDPEHSVERIVRQAPELKERNVRQFQPALPFPEANRTQPSRSDALPGGGNTVQVAVRRSRADAQQLPGPLELESEPGRNAPVFMVYSVAGTPATRSKTYVALHELYSGATVYVFARSMNDELVSLLNPLDALVASQSQDLGGAVVIVPRSADTGLSQLSYQASSFRSRNQIQQLGFTILLNQQTLQRWNLPKRAEVLLVLMHRGKVRSRAAFGPGELNRSAIANALADIRDEFHASK